MIDLQAAMAVAYRNEKPDQSFYPSFPHDKSCWEIMKRCWDYDPSRREEMDRLLQLLDAVLWRSLCTISFPRCSVLLKLTAYSVLPKKWQIKVPPQYPSCSWTETNNDSNIEGLAKSSLLDAHQRVSFWAETPWYDFSSASMCNLAGMLASLAITEYEPW